MDDVESNNEEMPALVPKVVQSNSDDFQVFVNDDFGKTMAVDVYPKMPVGVFVGMIGGLLEPTNEAELLIYFGPRRLEDGDSLQDVKTLEDYGIHDRAPPMQLTVVGHFLGGMNKNGKFRDEKKFDDQLDGRLKDMWQAIHQVENRQAGVLQATRDAEALGRRVDGQDAENLQLRNLLAALLARIDKLEKNNESIDDVKTLQAWMKNEKAKLKSFFEEARTFMTQLRTEVKTGTDSLQAQQNDLKALFERSFRHATEKNRRIHEKWEQHTEANAEKILATNAVLKKMVVDSLQTVRGLFPRVEALEMSMPTSALVCIAVCFSLVSYCLVFYCLVFSCLILLLIDY
jgi:hypothetical protein